MFDFDFYNLDDTKKCESLESIVATKAGYCIGIIQWIKINVYEDIAYENKPGMTSSHWPNPVFLFDEPVEVCAGDKLLIKASLYNDKIWFSPKN